jgi:glycosyltransferase involved in cell wall biosynthesis
MKHIYHFLLYPSIPSGPVSYVDYIISGVIGFEQKIIYYESNNKSEFILINLRRFSKWLYLIEVFVNAFVITCKLRLLNKEEIIIDCHHVLNLAPIVCAKILGIQLIWHIHELKSSNKLNVLFFKMGLYIANKSKTTVVYNSNATYKDYDYCGYVISPVIAAGKDPNKTYLNNDIICVANVNPVKGQVLLLKSLLKIEPKQRMTIHIVGALLESQKSYIGKVKSIQKKLHRNMNVVFHGTLDKKRIDELLLTTTFFVMTSLSESFGISLIEAMNKKCICVAPKIGEIPIILDDKSGFIYSAGQLSDLITVIETVLKLPISEREKYGEIVRKKFLQINNIDKFNKTHQEVYNN